MSIIQRLLDAEVLSIGLDYDKRTVEFYEACDWYYKLVLTKKELGEFIVELQKIEGEMVDE